VRPAISAPLAGILPGPDQPGTAIFIDLPPETTLGATVPLQRLGYIVVPVIQRWAVAPAVVRSERLLGLLVALAGDARAPTAVRGAAFLTDGRRFGTRGQMPALQERPRRVSFGRRFDNRYQYPICRFPPPELLIAQGFERAVWVPELIAPDLQPYAARLAAAGIAVVADPGQALAAR